MNDERGGIKYSLYVIPYPTNHIRLCGMKPVIDLHLLSPAMGSQAHGSMHITHVLQGLTELKTGELCLCGIIYHGLLTHALQETVHPARRVTSGKGIYRHGKGTGR